MLTVEKCESPLKGNQESRGNSSALLRWPVAHACLLVPRAPKLLPVIGLPHQAWFRMVSVMRRTNPVLEKRRQSAETLTRACRRWMTARNRMRAATALQALWRGGEGRATAASLR